MPRPSIPTQQLLGELAAAPSHIAALTAGLSAAQLHMPLRRGEWSATEVLAHLHSSADVWCGCMPTIIKGRKPAIRVMNPRPWIRRIAAGLRGEPHE